MAEAGAEAMTIVIPPHVGAVFETGRNRAMTRDRFTAKDLVPVYDVLDKNERKAWILENMRVFSDGTLSSPERAWKPVVDDMITELKFASNNSLRTIHEPAKKERIEGEIKDTEVDLKAIMAVSSSARAMEHSGGVASVYVGYISQSSPEHPNIDVQDDWAEYLLHKDAEKYRRVISMDIVKHYYDKVLEDAGIKLSVDEECGMTNKKGKVNEISQLEGRIDSSKARTGDLVKYLRKENYKGGFDAYIKEVLLKADSEDFILKQMGEDIDDTARWAAAKIACDAFLVEKYTRWEYEITKGYDPDSKDDLKMKPFLGWGGDPLRALLEPAFLPRRIKGVYRDKEDKAILGMFDLALRPTDVFKGELKGEELPATMVGHLKHYSRWSELHWTLLGGSRAQGLSSWSKETLENLPKLLQELSDTVYGEPINEPLPNEGKHIVGIMIARILECKALALAIESHRPGFKDNIRTLFGFETGRPFLEVEKFLWGPDLDGKKGFLVAMAGGRTRIVFRGNKYGAEVALKNTWEILSTNDQDPKGRGMATTLNTAGFILDIVQAIATGGKRRQ